MTLAPFFAQVCHVTSLISANLCSDPETDDSLSRGGGSPEVSLSNVALVPEDKCLDGCCLEYSNQTAEG